MKSLNIRKRAMIIVFCIIIGLVSVFCISNVFKQMAWLEASKPYEYIASLTYSMGGGYGVLEDMKTERWTINFNDNTIYYEVIKDIDGSIVDTWKKDVEQNKLDELRNILILNKFFGLPESYGNDMAADAPYVMISLCTNEAEHTTGGFMPGHQQFGYIQNEIIKLINSL